MLSPINMAFLVVGICFWLAASIIVASLYILRKTHQIKKEAEIELQESIHLRKVMLDERN